MYFYIKKLKSCFVLFTINKILISSSKRGFNDADSPILFNLSSVKGDKRKSLKFSYLML